MHVNVSRFQNTLTRWYEKHKRALPWRLKGNPYRIFVVEVMLQQTQIKTVIPYYSRWLKAFPTVHALARAPIDQVLKLWEGLGYYSRARNLHQAAKMIVRDFNGRIPDDAETLKRLPGIGPYTAGAISSIAFGKPVPLVDGNVARVFARFFNIKKDISKPDTQKKLYELAASLVPKKNPGIFNQALMELGSLVCVPEAPRCATCPMQSSCAGLKQGDPSRLPKKSNTVRVKKIEMVVGLLEKNGRVFIRKRPARGIWSGLWEIPGTIRESGQTREEALQAEFENALGMRVRIEKKDPVIAHRFTHRIASIHPFRLSARSHSHARNNGQKALWAGASDLKKRSFPVPHGKLLRELVKNEG